MPRHRPPKPPKPPSTTPPPTPEPYYVRLVVPKDKLQGDVVMAPAGQYTLDVAKQTLQRMANMFNSWLSSKSGYAMNFDCGVILSQYTLAEMQQGTADEFGEGCSLNFVWETVAAEDPALVPVIHGTGRHSLVVVGGGGVAGGLLGWAPPVSCGKAMNGDVEFSSVITGQLDPWSLAHSPGDAFKLGRSWSHELLHSMGVYCHAQDCFDRGEFAVPGTFACINSRFTVFPLQTGPADSEQWQLETKLYDGELAQMLAFSGPWVAKPA